MQRTHIQRASHHQMFVRAAVADHEIVQQVEAETIEMDELYSFAGTKRVVPESIADETGKRWVHCSMARSSRLLLEVIVAPRTLETAKILVKNTAARLARGCWPLWCTDDWESYVEALLSIFNLVLYLAFAKHRTTLELHVQLFKSYYNLCLAHSSLDGQTPAQAAG